MMRDAGQAITEYLLLGVAVLVVVFLVVNNAKTTAVGVADRELDRINAIPAF